MSDWEENQKIFNEIFEEVIEREGAKAFLEYLNKSDFFTAPASARYHSAFEGGLCHHSILTYQRLLKILSDEFGDEYQKYYSDETIAICGLLHDVCKIDYYKIDFRNVKVEGNWQQQPFYSVQEKLPYGHGEKSVYIINGFLKLSREEALAINWHMGGFDCRIHVSSSIVGEAFKINPLCLFLHIADLEATYYDENRGLLLEVEN